MLLFKILDNTLFSYGDKTKEWVAENNNKGIIELRPVNRDVGSLNMSKTWRMWMAEASAHWHHRGITMPHYVDAKGVPHGTRPINAEDCHQMYTMTFMGSDEQGNRLSWKMEGGDDGATVATKEQRLFAMDRFVQMAAEYAIPITIPRIGAYADYREAQEK